MNVNCGNIGSEEEFLNTTNINLLNRFNKTREIFPSVTRVLSNLLTKAVTSASIERVNSKEHVRCSLFDSSSQLCENVGCLQQ